VWANEFVGKNLVARTVNRVWFLPREMALCHTEMGPGWSFLPKTYPVMWWFYYHKNRGKLQLCMEVGPIADSKYRLRLLKRIEKAGFSFWKKGAFREESKYTRILSVMYNLQSNDQEDTDNDPEVIAKVAAELWAKGWADGKKIVEVLKSCKPKAS
jgi:hypothetical protein